MATLRDWLAGGRTAEIRIGAGLSRAALAREIGTDESAIFRWESRSRKPTGLYAAAYYRVLARLARTQQAPDDAGRMGGRDALVS